MSKVTIIGAGPQGTSLAFDFARQSYDVHVYDNNPDIRQEFLQQTTGRKNIHLYDDPNSAVKETDIVVLATPIDKFGVVLQDIGLTLKEGTIITDIGSAKVRAMQEIEDNLPQGCIYIGAHPIMGKAGVGPSSAEEGMYKDKTCVIVPAPEEFGRAQETVEKLWRDIGSEIAHMEAQDHDRLYGMISHFHHAVAFALTAMGEEPLLPGQATLDYSYGGNALLDITRISKSSVGMWVAIFIDNREFALEACQGFSKYLEFLKYNIEKNDLETLREGLGEAHRYARTIPEERKREGLLGEYFDVRRDFGLDQSAITQAPFLNEGFNRAADIALVERAGLPMLLGLSETLALQELGERALKNVDIPSLVCPSFRDSSALMLNDPEHGVAILQEHQNVLLKKLEHFEIELDEFMGHVKNKDREAMASYIKRAFAVRSTMPVHRTPDQMRPEYAIQTLYTI